jgi:tripartite-type tricarboxylate transporter receptor subunit TctC
LPVKRRIDDSNPRARHAGVHASWFASRPGRATGILATGILAMASIAAPAHAQDAVAKFYKGKQVTIVVGTGAGGGYDAYSRLIGRHMSKYIPGNPNVVVTNMPGAGSNTAANYIYSVAPKDGTQIGSVFAGALIEPLTSGKAVLFDPSRFQMLGSANDDVYVCIARKDAAVQTFKDAFDKEITMGASGSSSSAEVSTLLKHVLGTQFKIVLGYVGSRSIALAIERNEVQGACGFSWPSISVTNQGWFGPGGFMRVLVQTHVKGHPQLNAEHVPLVTDFARTPEERAIMELYFSHTTFGRPYVMAPGVPQDRLAAMRTAFMATMKDANFMAEARKMGMDIDAVDGDAVQRLVAKLYASPPDLIAKLKKALQGS